MSTVNMLSLEDRLNLRDYDPAECRAALRGEKIPYALGFAVNRLCVLRGIRYHPGFGSELRRLPGHPEFTRALNARSIMSNVIPDEMTSTKEEEDEIPYCIWYPDVAKEETYRELVQQYPQMRYQVGRACAVAGYVHLYRELDLLPEVSIAEEARDNMKNNEASAVIFEEIMAQPIKYAVMDDYTRSVNMAKPRPGAQLNGDTAIRSLLEMKLKFTPPTRNTVFEEITSFAEDFGIYTSAQYDKWTQSELKELSEDEIIFDPHKIDHYFNITEDWNIDESNSKLPSNDAMVPLLYSPLPADLPPGNKDLLILYAAYSGNVDRYTRLRRPQMLKAEGFCVIRGIYHDTMFAKWWSLQSEGAVPATNTYKDSDIRSAINARFIMNNDLSRITEETPDCDLPYLIWYPSWADASTYEELARRRPDMKAQAARACIVADYEVTYDRIQPTPDFFLVEEARLSPNPHYLKDLLARAAQLHIDIYTVPDFDGWKRYITQKWHMEGHRSTFIPETVGPHSVGYEQESAYDGVGADMSEVELFVCTPDEIKQVGDGYGIDLSLIYREACRPTGLDPPLWMRGRGRGRGRGCGGRS